MMPDLINQTRIKPMSNPFMQLRIMYEHLHDAIDDYRIKPTDEGYDEIIRSAKDYRVAWTQLYLYHCRTSDDIRQDEQIIEHAKIYKETKTGLVESAIDSLDRHLGFTGLFLKRAKHQEDPL